MKVYDIAYIHVKIHGKSNFFFRKSDNSYSYEHRVSVVYSLSIASFTRREKIKPKTDKHPNDGHVTRFQM